MVDGPKLRVQVRVIPFIGPGKMMLLDGIERHGSISAAARTLDMSYARAWRLIAAMNVRFTSPLVEKATGGQGGGGTTLTDTGKAVLGIYRSMEEKAKILFAGDLEALGLLLAPDPNWTEQARPTTDAKTPDCAADLAAATRSETTGE